MSFGSALAPGVILGGDFVVQRPLSEGGMGSVWVAEQKSTGRLRAVKVMHPALMQNAALRERFEREARIGAQIQSAHVVEVLAAGVSPLPWLAMELLEGEDLAAFVARRGAVPPSEVRAIFEQLCHAVAAAHDRGIVHRDLKPENVFLARSSFVGMPFVVKVLDFGIAKLADEASTRAKKNTASIGSRPWMAPEQLSIGTRIGPATDVWALGLIAFTLLTGKLYWRSMYDDNANDMMLLVELTTSTLVPASQRARENHSDVVPSPSFDAWFSQCAVRDAGQRFRDARAAFLALDAVLRETKPAETPAPVAPRAVANATVPMPPAPRATGTLLMSPSDLPEELANHLKWEALHAEYVRIEKSYGASPVPLAKFRAVVSARVKDVMQKHGCRNVEMQVIDHDGRAHLQANPVHDDDEGASDAARVRRRG